MAHKLINQLKAYKKRTGKPNYDIAYEIGVSFPTLCRWLRDEFSPRIDNLLLIEKYLKRHNGNLEND